MSEHDSSFEEQVDVVMSMPPGEVGEECAMIEESKSMSLHTAQNIKETVYQPLIQTSQRMDTGPAPELSKTFGNVTDQEDQQTCS